MSITGMNNKLIFIWIHLKYFNMTLPKKSVELKKLKYTIMSIRFMRKYFNAWKISISLRFVCWKWRACCKLIRVKYFKWKEESRLKKIYSTMQFGYRRNKTKPICTITLNKTGSYPCQQWKTKTTGNIRRTTVHVCWGKYMPDYSMLGHNSR